MQATARMASVVSSTLPARRRLIRSVRPCYSTPLGSLDPCVGQEPESGKRQARLSGLGLGASAQDLRYSRVKKLPSDAEKWELDLLSDT